MQVSTDARCVVQGVPGFVPRVLRDAEVGLFRAEDRVFDAMLDGWKAQMLARGLTAQTIEGRCRVLRRFQEYAGTFPWTWRPVDLDDYMAERRSGEKPISLTMPAFRQQRDRDVLCLLLLAHLRLGRSDHAGQPR
jgi:hypothetical protein